MTDILELVQRVAALEAELTVEKQQYALAQNAIRQLALSFTQDAAVCSAEEYYALKAEVAVLKHQLEVAAKAKNTVSESEGEGDAKAKAEPIVEDLLDLSVQDDYIDGNHHPNSQYWTINRLDPRPSVERDPGSSRQAAQRSSSSMPKHVPLAVHQSIVNAAMFTEDATEQEQDNIFREYAIRYRNLRMNKREWRSYYFAKVRKEYLAKLEATNGESTVAVDVAETSNAFPEAESSEVAATRLATAGSAEGTTINHAATGSTLPGLGDQSKTVEHNEQHRKSTEGGEPADAAVSTYPGTGDNSTAVERAGQLRDPSDNGQKTAVAATAISNGGDHSTVVESHERHRDSQVNDQQNSWRSVLISGVPDVADMATALGLINGSGIISAVYGKTSEMLITPAMTTNTIMLVFQLAAQAETFVHTYSKSPLQIVLPSGDKAVLEVSRIERPTAPISDRILNAITIDKATRMLLIYLEPGPWGLEALISKLAFYGRRAIRVEDISDSMAMLEFASIDGACHAREVFKIECKLNSEFYEE